MTLEYYHALFMFETFKKIIAQVGLHLRDPRAVLPFLETIRDESFVVFSTIDNGKTAAMFLTDDERIAHLNFSDDVGIQFASSTDMLDIFARLVTSITQSNVLTTNSTWKSLYEKFK